MLKSLGLGVFAGAAVLVCPSARAQLPSGGPWALRFADEFDDAYAGNIMGLDPDKWNPAYPWTRVHNYPAYIRDENILVNTNDNGLLQLWGKRENYGGQPFTSGAINSNGHLNLGLVGQAGYMEARMKMPNFLGAWPAFWALQEGWPPEIDTMEFVRNGPGSSSPNISPNNYLANVHFINSSGQAASSWSDFKDAGAGDLTAAFHNYGLRWTDSTLTWYIDGRQFHSYTGATAIAQMQRMYLILNLGIGGWAGDPPPGEDVNKSFDVDWVRVWMAGDAPQSNYVGPAGGNQNWDGSASWSNGAPKLSSTTAFFGNLSGGTSVTLDWVDTKTVRGLTFRTGSSYRIGWADDQLMLTNWDTSSSAIPEALIDVQVDPGSAVQGTQTIASRVELHSNTRVKNATANVLAFLSDVHGDGALTLDSGRTSFGGGVFHRGGTYVVGSADATFAKSLGTPGSAIYVGTTTGSNSTLRLGAAATGAAMSHLRLGDAGGTGVLVQSGGAVTVTGGEAWVGQGAGSTGTYDHAAGSLTLSNWLAVGRAGATGTYRLSGNAVLNKLGAGHLIIGSLGGVGTFTQTGGAVNVQSGNTLLGEDAGSAGTYTLSGGTAALGEVILSQRGTGNGTFNLDGGTVTAARVGRAGTGTGTFNFNGGTLRAARADADLISNLTAANIRGGGAIIDTNGLNVGLSQPLMREASLGAAPDGGLSKSGTGVLTLSAANTYFGPTSVNAGTLRVTGSVANSAVQVNIAGTFEAPVTQKVRALMINAGGTVTLPNSAAGKTVLTVGDGTAATASPFAVPASGTSLGRVDLNANGLVIDVAAGGEAAAMASVRDAIRPAYANGAWTGNGLTSSTITGANRLALGYALPADAPASVAGGQFFGVAADASSVVVRTTLAADTNLDAVVNFADLLNLARNYNQAGKFWAQGDSSYDGVVNFADLLNLARNYNQSVPTGPVPGAPADFEVDMAAAFAAIPEPGSLGLLGFGACFGLGRRRRIR